MFKNNSKNKSKLCIPPGKYIGLCQSLIWRFNLISSRFLPNLVPKSSISKSSASNNAVSKSSHELCWSHLWLWWQLFPNQDRDQNSNVAMSTSDFELLEVQFSSTWEMTWEWSWYLLNPSYMYLTLFSHVQPPLDLLWAPSIDSNISYQLTTPLCFSPIAGRKGL